MKSKKKKFDVTKDPKYIKLNKQINKHSKKLWISPIHPNFKCDNEDDIFFKIYKCDNKNDFKNIPLKEKVVKATRVKKK